MQATALHFLLLTVSGWVTRRQLAAIDYLREENRVLRAQLGLKRPRLTDDQRRGLAEKGRALGRKALGELASIATPDTILRWYRQLIACKYDGATTRKTGRSAQGGHHRAATMSRTITLSETTRASATSSSSRAAANSNAQVQRRRRLGGLLNHYYREAA